MSLTLYNGTCFLSILRGYDNRPTSKRVGIVLTCAIRVIWSPLSLDAADEDIIMWIVDEGHSL